MSDKKRYWETSKFKQLQQNWYKKLEKSGFEDAEDNPVTDNPYLKHWDAHWFRTRKGGVLGFEAKQEYFIMASKFLHDYRFDSREEKQVWKLHSDGLSFPEIAEKLEISIYKVKRLLKPLIRTLLTWK